jgi:hypothetical protein
MGDPALDKPGSSASHPNGSSHCSAARDPASAGFGGLLQRLFVYPDRRGAAPLAPTAEWTSPARRAASDRHRRRRGAARQPVEFSRERGHAVAKSGHLRGRAREKLRDVFDGIGFEQGTHPGVPQIDRGGCRVSPRYHCSAKAATSSGRHRCLTALAKALCLGPKAAGCRRFPWIQFIVPAHSQP